MSLGDSSSVSEGNVTVNADPYVDQLRQNVFFRASFPQESVLAVHLLVENRRQEPVRIDPTAITITLPDGNSLRPKEGTTLIDFLGIVPEPPPLFSTDGLLDAFAGPPYSKAQIPYGAPYSLNYGEDRQHRWRVRRWFLAKYKGMQLQDRLIGPGGTASGFVYFIDVEERDQFKLASLRVPMAEKHRADGIDLVFPFIGAASGHSRPLNQGWLDVSSTSSRGSAALVLLGPDDIASTAAAMDKPLYQPWQIRGYLLRHSVRFRAMMNDYNKQHRILVDERDGTGVGRIYRTKVKEASGNRVVLEVGLIVGNGVNANSNSFAMEFEWRDDHLEVVGPPAG